MKLTRKHVQLFESIGSQIFRNSPANMEFEDGTSAVEEFKYIAVMQAALATFKTMGIVDQDAVLELRTPYNQ